MRPILIPSLLAALAFAVVAGGRDGQAQTQTPCPEGQVRTAEGTCTSRQPATCMTTTEHQQEVLKKPEESGATGSTGGSNMPATRHQQETIKPSQGTPQQ